MNQIVIIFAKLIQTLQMEPKVTQTVKNDPNNQLNQNEGSSPHVRLESLFDLEDASTVTTSLVMFANTFR
jgi:hypothetical protein